MVKRRRMLEYLLLGNLSNLNHKTLVKQTQVSMLYTTISAKKKCCGLLLKICQTTPLYANMQTAVFLDLKWFPVNDNGEVRPPSAE